MALHYVNLPLYQEPDYQYTISLERVSYKVRFYFVERVEKWAIDLRYANNDPIILGAFLAPEYPLFFDYHIEGMSGSFWLEPIGKDKNETIINPYELNEYYRLFYIYED